MTAPRSNFRHLDNLMGIREDQVAEAAHRQSAVELQRVMDAWAAEVNVLQDFQRSEAWALMKAAFENEALVVRSALATCTEPTTLAKGVGALLLLEGFQNWPQDRVRDLLQNLEQAKTA